MVLLSFLITLTCHLPMPSVHFCSSSSKGYSLRRPKMNEPTPHMISVRAVEDIIQIQKLIEDAPNLKTIQLGKEKSSERIVYSVLKHDIYSPETGNNTLGCFLKECDVEKSFKCNEKSCKRLDLNGWESDYGLTKYINPDVVVLENFGIIEPGGSDPDVKYWSSDSDVTVLRVRKEFRNELSNKMEWEEQRNLADDVSLSSTNLDWESHSLINLAGIVGKEKDPQENLTPFTIWSSSRKNSSMHLVENTQGSLTVSEENTPEVRIQAENSVYSETSKGKKAGPKRKRFRKLFTGVFSCFVKKKSF